MPQTESLAISHRHAVSDLSMRNRREFKGFAMERIQTTSIEPYEYSFNGDTHYLALHDMVHEDAELIIDGLPRRNDLDLRDLITFVPKGCSVQGWAKPARAKNSFLAVYFDPAALNDEIGLRYQALGPEPFVHRRDPSLQSTLLKLQALTAQDAQDDLHAESLCLLSAIEVFGVLSDPAGRLSDRQVSIVRDFIEAHLASPISLADMATVVGLSRYHFSRAFKRATGESPSQFVRRLRIERSKSLLRSGDLPLEMIAAAVGFNGLPQFRRVFREIVGSTPQRFKSDRN